MTILPFLALTCISDLAASVPKLPDPRIVIVGHTGAGKSSLANALLGCDPRESTCTFPVCGGLESCTKETTIGTGPWLGTGNNFTVVDTPGFGDSAGEDNQLIEEMMKVFNDSLGYSNIILLLFDGQTARFNSGLHNMLRQMSSLFGEAWWDYMVIGVSKWKYSQAAIHQRQDDCDYYGDPSENCKNEAWFMREMTGQLQDKFHLDRNFTFAFIDAFSQAGPALNDQVQQEHYQAEAGILWDSATTKNSTFDFKTIDDVLDENEFLKNENKRLKDIIETDITTLFSLVRENEGRIDGSEKNITSIEKKTNVMNDNITSIDEKTNVLNDILEGVVDDVGNLLSSPLGTIIAWISKPTAEAKEFADIPAGWQRCDGSTIPPPSIWAGQKTPDLNHEKRFLRGGDDKDMLTMEMDQLQDHIHNFHDPGHTHGYYDRYYGYNAIGTLGPTTADYVLDDFSQPHYATSLSGRTGITVGAVKSPYRRGTETRPKNMNVIYIMRIF